MSWLPQTDDPALDLRFWRGHQSLEWISFDVNADGSVTPLDALKIVNQLAAVQRGVAESEFTPTDQPDALQTANGVPTDIVHSTMGRVGMGKAWYREQRIWALGRVRICLIGRFVLPS